MAKQHVESRYIYTGYMRESLQNVINEEEMSLQYSSVSEDKRQKRKEMYPDWKVYIKLYALEFHFGGIMNHFFWQNISEAKDKVSMARKRLLLNNATCHEHLPHSIGSFVLHEYVHLGCRPNCEKRDMIVK